MKTHEALHIVQEDVKNVGDLRNVHCLTGERWNHRVKSQHSNGHNISYWKTFTFMVQCMFEPIENKIPGKIKNTATDKDQDIQQYQLQLSTLAGNIYFYVL
jgi:hypothetical protein